METVGNLKLKQSFKEIGKAFKTQTYEDGEQRTPRYLLKACNGEPVCVSRSKIEQFLNAANPVCSG